MIDKAHAAAFLVDLVEVSVTGVDGVNNLNTLTQLFNRLLSVINGSLCVTLRFALFVVNLLGVIDLCVSRLLGVSLSSYVILVLCDYLIMILRCLNVVFSVLYAVLGLTYGRLIIVYSISSVLDVLGGGVSIGLCLTLLASSIG